MGISAAFAAVFSGTATVAAVATVVTVVGAGMTVVGMVTGNKALTKWGSYLSLAGGITSLAAGAFGAAAGTAGEVAAGAAIDPLAGEAISNAAGYGAESAFMGAEGASLTAGLPEAATSGLGAAETGTQFGQVNNFGQAPPDLSAQPGGMNGPPVDTSTGFKPPTDGIGTPNQFGQPSIPGGVTPPPPVVPSTGEGWLSKWWNSQDKATQAKYVTSLMQTGGQALGGLFTGWSEEQKLEFQKNAAALQEQHYQTAMSNANAQPSFSKPKPSGLLNSMKAA